MIRIAVDCRFSGSNTGLGRYTRSLVSSITSINEPIEWVLLVRSLNEPWLKFIHENVEIITADISHYSISEQIIIPRLLKKAKVDLFFATHFNVPYFCKTPFIFTLHDLILHSYPNQAPFIKRLFYKILIRRNIKKSKFIIAVSKFTAKECIRIYGQKYKNKIHVISEGVDYSFTPSNNDFVMQIQNKYNLNKPYFIYVGNAKEHKNLPFLFKAFKNSGRGEDLVLVCFDKSINKIHIPLNSRVLENVEDSDLPALYSGAVAFITASLYEGFCLPILEALSCGCNVIAPKSSAIAELSMPGVILCDPTMEAFQTALRTFVPDKNFNKPDFRWDVCAKKTLSVILSLNKVK